MINKKTKIISLILAFLIVFNFIGSCCYADAIITNDKEVEDFKKIQSVLGSNPLDGIAGVATYGIKLVILGIGMAINGVFTVIGDIFGTTNGVTSLSLSIEDILFNGLNLTNVNFFKATNNSSMNDMQQNIAKWYFAIRNLSIVILLCILIYVGIRMAISSVADDKARYKNMLMDWLISIALIFVLHYIMILTVTINENLVDILNPGSSGAQTYNTTFATLLGRSVGSVSFNYGMGNAIVYLILNAITLVFLIMYVKRMLTVAFLTMIAPLICITYSIDKIGDGKSQALNTWTKEYMYNILIQPFHCITYLAFASISINLIRNNATLGASVVAVMVLFFITRAESIIKKIFGFDKAGSMAGAVAAGAMVTGAMSKVGTVAKGAMKSTGSVAGEGASGGGGELGEGSTPTMSDVPDMSSEEFQGQEEMPETEPEMENTPTYMPDTEEDNSDNDYLEEDLDKELDKNLDKNQDNSGSSGKERRKPLIARMAGYGLRKAGEKINGKYRYDEYGTRRNNRQIAGAMALGYARFSLKGGAKLAAAIVGAAVSEEPMTGMIAGHSVGKNVGKWSDSKIAKKVDKKRQERAKGAQENLIASNEKVFENKYNEASNEMNSYLGGEQNQEELNDTMLEYSKDILDKLDENNGNLDEIEEPNREYAKYLKGMRDTYAATGEEKPSEKVLDKIREIQRKNISNNNNNNNDD